MSLTFWTVAAGVTLTGLVLGSIWLGSTSARGEAAGLAASRGGAESAARVPEAALATDGPAAAAFVLIPVFDILDCNRADAIDAAQVEEHFSQMFAPLDRDRSRTLSLDEYVGAIRGAERQARERLFARIDVNTDGIASVKEYRNHLFEMIELADTNKDGEVTRAELLAQRQ